MTLIIEILHITNKVKEIYLNSETEEKKRMLSYFLKYKIAVSVSAFLFLVMAALLFIAIFKGIMNIRKLKRNPKLNLVIVQGLNQRNLIFSFLYFLHFFFIRTFIVFMVILS